MHTHKVRYLSLAQYSFPYPRTVAYHLDIENGLLSFPFCTK